MMRRSVMENGKLEIDVVKRDGEVVKFDRSKIEKAIEKAFIDAEIGRAHV